MKTLTELHTEFNESIRPLIVEQYGEDDQVALNEEWSNYTDSACKDGEITQLQYHHCPSLDDQFPDDWHDEELEFLLFDCMDVKLASEFRAERPDNLMQDSATHWLVTITRHDQSMQLYYSMGSAHTGTPEALDVLHCVLSDRRFAEEDFSGFCSELGYDEDSRTAEHIYGEVRKQAQQLKQLFSESELDDLDELFADY